MYEGYFGLTERPFSIAPDPHYLYMSPRHKEATAHLSYGLSQGGCFIVLTGEVGTGKTTLCRNLLSDLPQNVDVALILNANINESELLQTVCDELGILYDKSGSQKELLDLINMYLLATFADNRHTVLIIDEAQLLSRDVLEQIRLLTNLETTKSKLLQIILIGQPELNDLLSRNDLRQLAQRVTARYHLDALERSEIEDYINFRLGVAGCKQALFSRQALTKMHALTAGIPRKINVLADHALLSTYSKNLSLVDAKTIKKAAQDVFISSEPADRPTDNSKRWWAVAALFLLLNVIGWWFFTAQNRNVPISTGEIVNPSASSSEPSSANTIATKKTREATSIDSETAVEAEPVANNDSSVASGQSSTIEPALTSIKIDELSQPGTVQISDEYLDAGSSKPAEPELENFAADSDSEFGRVLDTSADLTGRNVAARVLAKQWGIEFPTPMLKAYCQEVKQHGLSCIGPRSWRQLIRYNRPAMMVLSHLNQYHRVVFVGINGDVATVLVGPDRYRLPVAELRQRWNQNSVVYWRPGQAGNRLLQYEDEYSELGKTRLHLNAALSRINMPVLEDVESTIFDLEMSQKVFALQNRFDISDDSKIGHETYMLMNEIISPNEIPVLTNRVR